MGLFKKKKEAKPLSSLPQLPQMPEMPIFPEFPKLQENQGFQTEEKELPNSSMFSLPSLPPLPRSSFGLEEIKTPVQKAMTEEIEEKEEPDIARLKEPIFVKIDRYREAVTNLEIIKKKLHETSGLLEKIRETRAKEEEELDSWMQEVNTIKEKIEFIDKKLFHM